MRSKSARSSRCDPVPTPLSKLAEMWDELEPTSLQKRYDFAKALLAVVSTQSQPNRMDAIADYLKVGKRTLYDFLAVAKVIETDELVRLASLKDESGYGFTWTHLRFLVKLRDRDSRRAMVRRWKQEALDSTRFSAIVCEKVAQSRKANSQKICTSPSKSRLLSVINNARQLFADLEVQLLNARNASKQEIDEVRVLLERVSELQLASGGVYRAFAKVAANVGIDVVLHNCADCGAYTMQDSVANEGSSQSLEGSKTVGFTSIRMASSRSGRRRKHGKPGSAVYANHERSSIEPKPV